MTDEIPTFHYDPTPPATIPGEPTTVVGRLPDGRELTVDTYDPAALEGAEGHMVSGPAEVGAEVLVWPVKFETASERVRREARARLTRKRYVRAVARLHDALVTSAVMRSDDVAVAVLKLHAPDETASGAGIACAACDHGCDELVEWPCATVTMIGEHFGVDLTL